MNTQCCIWIIAHGPPLKAIITSKVIPFWRTAFLSGDVSGFNKDRLWGLPNTLLSEDHVLENSSHHGRGRQNIQFTILVLMVFTPEYPWSSIQVLLKKRKTLNNPFIVQKRSQMDFSKVTQYVMGRAEESMVTKAPRIKPASVCPNERVQETI